MLSCIVDRNKFSRNRLAILVIEKSQASLRRIATEMLASRSLWVTLMCKCSQNIRHHMISDYLTSNKELPVVSTAMMCSISMTSPSFSAEAELENQVPLAQTLKMYRRVCERWNSSNKSHQEVTLLVWIPY